MANGEIRSIPENHNSGAGKTTFPPRKGFLYKAPYIKGSELNNIIQTHAHLRITLNNDVLNDWKAIEIDIWTSTTSGEFIYETTSHGSDSKTQKRNINMTFYTDDFRGNNETSTSYFITLDKPLDLDEFKKGNQNIYKVDDIDASIIDVPDELDGLLSVASATEGRLTDIKSWENEEKTFEVDIDLIDSSIKTKSLDISMSKYSDVYYIIVRGKDTNGVESATPFKITGSDLTPMMMNIIEVENKLVKYIPWFDYDITMPLASAKKFITANNIKTITSDDTLIEAILDIFMLSYAYDDEFSFVEYVIEGNDAGKIKGNQYIGYQAKQASSIQGKTLSSVLDSRYNRYLLDTKLPETDENVRILKQMIAALSRFTAGQLAIGKGNNLFHSAYLPWYLDFFGTIRPKQIDVPSPIPGSGAKVKSWVLDKDATKFQLKSRYFALSATGEITLPDEITLSQTKVIQTDRKITLPYPKEFHTPQDKIPSPGDINPKSSKDISFLGFSFIEGANLQQLFGTTKNFSIEIKTDKQITSNNPSAAIAKVYNVATDASKLFNDIGYQGNLITGQIEETTSEIRIDFVETISTSPFIGTNSGGDTTFVFTSNGKRASFHFRSLDRGKLANDYKAFIAKEFNIDTSLIEKVVMTGASNGNDGVYTGFATATIKKYRLATGFVYNVNAGQSLTSSIYDRQAVFDKDSKIEEIELFTPTALAGDINKPITLQLKKEIEITEIIIGRDWGQSTTISFNGMDFKTTDFNTKDESIAVDKYIFR